MDEIEKWLIVGLGNNGEKYEKTFHNIGFLFINKLAEAKGVLKWSKKFAGFVSNYIHENKQVILFKPSGFINNSGSPVSQIKRFYKIPLKI